MTATEQKELVSQLSVNVANEVLDLIDRGKVPADWDGHELRALLADKHLRNAAASLIKREPRSRRARNYNNARLTIAGL